MSTLPSSAAEAIAPEAAVRARFTAAVVEEGRTVDKVARLFADTPEARADLEQEILLQAWCSYGGFDGRSAFKTWLYRVAINVGLGYVRSEHRRTRREADHASAVMAAPDEANPQAERLYAAIRTLGRVDRSLIALHLDGYDNAEIAELLEASPGAIATRLTRIRARLTDLLNPQRP